MSEIRARASRRAFCLGSWTMNGFTGRNGPVFRLPGTLVPAAAGADDASAADEAGRTEGAGGAGGGGGAGGTGGAGARVGDGVATAGAPAPSGLMANTLLHTLQRARKPPAGTLAGSTRYTVSHEGQVTFTPLLRFLRLRGRDHGADRPRTPILPASSRNSSSRSPTH